MGSASCAQRIFGPFTSVFALEDSDPDWFKGGRRAQAQAGDAGDEASSIVGDVLGPLGRAWKADGVGGNQRM